MKFKLLNTDSKSSGRVGEILTGHGKISTPAFMPVGTLGAVKAVHQKDIDHDIDPDILLSNTYHLYLRPGMDVIRKAGGLHGFNGWGHPVLTDSGGYQVYSLSQNRKITEKGVEFQSHIDGSRHFFTPENVVDIQRVLGSDIMMVLDECPPYPCEKTYAKNSMEMTHRWLKRAKVHFQNTNSLYEHDQTLFPIVQGGTFPDLRKESAEFISGQDLEGNAIGGLSVGEPEELLYEMTDLTCRILPEDKPRYLMGVGMPANIIEAVALGVDMFDCVIPTRNGRNGMIFTWEGIINIKNRKWKENFEPLDRENDNYFSQFYSRAYLRHLITSKEVLGFQIASVHNLSFYMNLLSKAREMIRENKFAEWKSAMIPKLKNRL